jgi:hypothetical protein
MFYLVGVPGSILAGATKIFFFAKIPLSFCCVMPSHPNLMGTLPLSASDRAEHSQKDHISFG